jgi:hypothetical protein
MDARMTLPLTKQHPTGPIALIEPHDSRVDEVVISPAGLSRIDFAHLAVYHACDGEKFEIWSYRAVLEAQRVYRMIVDGCLEITDYVDDGVVVLFGKELVDWKELLESRAATQIKLTFGSGKTIDIHCHEAQLRLRQPIRHVEDWTGPLYSPAS